MRLASVRAGRLSNVVLWSQLMSSGNRSRRKFTPSLSIVDALEPRLLLTGVDCCADDVLDGSVSELDQIAPSQVGIASTSGTETGEIRRGNRNDWFDVTVTEDSNATITLTELSDNLTLRLYDQNNRRIARSTRGGTNDEAINIELEPGEYRIRVTGHRRATGTYQLDWQLDSIDGAGNTRETARDLGTVGSALFQDRVSPEDQLDVFRFTVDERSELDLGLTDLSADADLYLFDADGRRLASSFLSGSQDEQISGTIGAGTYFAAVSPWEDADTSYTFTVEATSIVDDTPTDGGDTDAFPDVPDLRGTNNWHLNAVNAPEAWAQGYTGDGVLVAVLDTGVSLDHPDLASNIYVNPGEIAGNGIDDDGNGFVDDINGWDFTTNTNDADDVHGHGTHVAGIIGAGSNGFGATGVAYDATILPVQVLSDSGSGSNRSVADGIRYAVDVGADIINLSLGGGFSSTILSALRYAEANDVLVVAAAGNESADIPSHPAIFSNQLDNTLSVGAFSSSNQLASFSNRVGGSGAVQIDAPGVSVYSTYADGRYARLSGTSMAAPNAAGVAALALSANADLSAAELRTLLVNGAIDTVASSDSIGRVNAATTVAYAAAGATSNSLASARASNGNEDSSNQMSATTTTTVAQNLTATAVDVSSEDEPAETFTRVLVATDTDTALPTTSGESQSETGIQETDSIQIANYDSGEQTPDSGLTFDTELDLYFASLTALS